MVTSNMQILDKKLFDERLPAIADVWFDKGISCYCFNTADDGMVFKLFKYKEYAQTAYNNQLLATYAGLGPLLYSGIIHLRTNLRPYGDIEAWGFYCEKVETFFSCIPPDQVKNYGVDFSELQIKMASFFGVKWCDTHYGNVGYKMNRQGKRQMVCIDFGEESFGCSDSKPSIYLQLEINWPHTCSAAEQVLSDIVDKVI